jgi:hypothetical protein
MPCTPLKTCRRFAGTCHLHLSGSNKPSKKPAWNLEATRAADPEDGSDMFLRNVCWLSTDVISQKRDLFISHCYNLAVLRTSICDYYTKTSDLRADNARWGYIIKTDVKDVGVRVWSRFCRVTGRFGGGLSWRRQWTFGSLILHSPWAASAVYLHFDHEHGGKIFDRTPISIHQGTGHHILGDTRLILTLIISILFFLRGQTESTWYCGHSLAYCTSPGWWWWWWWCGAIGGMRIGRGDIIILRKPAPVSLCPPQIQHCLTRAAWATARPSYPCARLWRPI